MNQLWSGMLAIVLVLFPLAPACAQGRPPLHFAVTGGASRDVLGNFEGSRNGTQVGLMLERTGEIFGVRTEAFYSRFRSEREQFFCVAGQATSIIGPCPSVANRNEVGALTLAGLAGVDLGRTRVYAIAGGGAYRFVRREETTTTNPCPECLTGTESAQTAPMVSTTEHTSAHFGMNIGLGALYDTGPVDVFFETRYHHLVGGGDDRGFIPITLGLRF